MLDLNKWIDKNKKFIEQNPHHWVILCQEGEVLLATQVYSTYSQRHTELYHLDIIGFHTGIPSGC